MLYYDILYSVYYGHFCNNDNNVDDNNDNNNDDNNHNDDDNNHNINNDDNYYYEANDNAKFLTTLETSVGKLMADNMEFEQFDQTFHPVMHGILMT